FWISRVWGGQLDAALDFRDPFAPGSSLPPVVERPLHTGHSDQDAYHRAETRNHCNGPPHAHVTSRQSLHVAESHGSIRLLRVPVPPPQETVAVDFGPVEHFGASIPTSNTDLTRMLLVDEVRRGQSLHPPARTT